MKIAIDSSLLVGLIHAEDVWHSRAVALWTAIQQAGYTSVYFDCVAGEAVSTAMRRLREKKRLAEITHLLTQSNNYVPPAAITWVFPDLQRLYPEVLTLMQTSGGTLNFNDALIALACREREIPVIASFDADFDQVSWLRRLARPEEVSKE